MKLSFLDRVPALELRDPLAEVLGELAPGETFRYEFADAVRLAGHCCPTIAGAWLVAVAGLEALYGKAPGVRGEIAVTVGGDPDDGSAGPVSQVLAFVTGAAPETGFRGLMGKWKRNDLLGFDPTLVGWVRFRRTDDGSHVDVAYDPHPVPAAPELGGLMTKVLTGKATPEERTRFGELWQARVEAILTGPRERVIRTRRDTARL